MVVDASVWVAYFLTADVHHHASLRWLQEQTRLGIELLVPDLALPEVSGPVARSTGRPDEGLEAAHRMVQRVGIRRVGLDRQLMDQAMMLAARLRLRGADAVYVAVALRHRVPLVTWDTQMRARAGGVVPVLQP